MSDEFMEGIGAIVASGGSADVEHAVGLGASGSIADAGTFTFTVTSQKDMKPERLELTIQPETATGGVEIETFTIAGENQLGSSDKIGAVVFHPQAPIIDLEFDTWTSGSSLIIKVNNKSGAACYVYGTVYGQLQE